MGKIGLKFIKPIIAPDGPDDSKPTTKPWEKLLDDQCLLLKSSITSGNFADLYSLNKDIKGSQKIDNKRDNKNEVTRFKEAKGTDGQLGDIQNTLQATANINDTAMREYTDKIQNEMPKEAKTEADWEKLITGANDSLKKKVIKQIDDMEATAKAQIGSLPGDDSLKIAAAQLYSSGIELISTAFDVLVTQAKALLNKLADFVKHIWDSVTAAYKVVKAAVGTALAGIEGLFGTVFPLLAISDINESWYDILVDGLKGGLGDALQTIDNQIAAGIARPDGWLGLPDFIPEKLADKDVDELEDWIHLQKKIRTVTDEFRKKTMDAIKDLAQITLDNFVLSKGIPSGAITGRPLYDELWDMIDQEAAIKVPIAVEFIHSKEGGPTKRAMWVPEKNGSEPLAILSPAGWIGQGFIPTSLGQSFNPTIPDFPDGRGKPRPLGQAAPGGATKPGGPTKVTK